MKLTWRDGITTLLAALIVGVYYAVTRDIGIPVVGNYMGGILTVALITAIIGFVGMEQRDVEETGWLGTMMVVGVVALGIFVASLFYATQAWLLAVTIAAVTLWAVGMLHHFVSESEHVEAPGAV